MSDTAPQSESGLDRSADGLLVPEDVARQRAATVQAAQPRRQQAIAAFVGGWKGYVNAQRIVAIRTFANGSEYIVNATVDVLDVNNQPMNVQIGPNFATEDEALDYIDEFLSKLPIARLTPMRRPEKYGPT